MKDKEMNAKTIKVIKDSIKNHDKLKSFDNTEDAMKWLTDKIEQLEDKKLHENEFGFDILCEKYVDDCAMRAMQGLLSHGVYDNIYADNLAAKSYYIAETMLEEKLKRKNDR